MSRRRWDARFEQPEGWWEAALLPLFRDGQDDDPTSPTDLVDAGVGGVAAPPLAAWLDSLIDSVRRGTQAAEPAALALDGCRQQALQMRPLGHDPVTAFAAQLYHCLGLTLCDLAEGVRRHDWDAVTTAQGQTHQVLGYMADLLSAAT